MKARIGCVLDDGELRAYPIAGATRDFGGLDRCTRAGSGSEDTISWSLDASAPLAMEKLREHMLRAMVVGLALLATSSIVSVAQTQLNAAEIRRDSGLLAICTNAEPDERSVAAALCTGYLQGVVEGVNFATLGDHDKLLICRPSDVTAEQMREVVVKYLKNHHNEGHQLSVIHSTEAFVQAWPCKSSAAPR